MVMTRKEVEDFILSMPNSRLDYPFGEDVAVYKVAVDDEEKMFALMPEKKEPINLSLKCDPTLAKLLRGKYESVMEGYHLNKKHWNTMLLTGQLEDQEVKDLIVHSYNMVIGNKDHVPSFK
jgi:predicted DNA-binding protein (MmcQ/YjbR family)